MTQVKKLSGVIVLAMVLTLSALSGPALAGGDKSSDDGSGSTMVLPGFFRGR